MKKSILAVIFTLFGVQSLLACSYGPPYMSVCEAYSIADLIVTGKVVLIENISASIQDPNISSQKVKILVDKTFKGDKKKEIIFTQEYTTCSWDFSKTNGKTVLIYLRYDTKEKNYNPLIGLGGKIETQYENLSWLKKLPGSLSRTRISGEVNYYESSDVLFDSPLAVAGMKLNILGETKNYEAVTDKNGIYEIWDIPVGKYKIAPQMPVGFELRFPLSRGIIDFKPISKDEVDTKDFKVEIKPKGCGGSDYILNRVKK